MFWNFWYALKRKLYQNTYRVHDFRQKTHCVLAYRFSFGYCSENHMRISASARNAWKRRQPKRVAKWPTVEYQSLVITSFFPVVYCLGPKYAKYVEYALKLTYGSSSCEVIDLLFFPLLPGLYFFRIFFWFPYFIKIFRFLRFNHISCQND